MFIPGPREHCSSQQIHYVGTETNIFKHQVHCPQLECMLSVTFQKVSLFLGVIFLQC